MKMIAVLSEEMNKSLKEIQKHTHNMEEINKAFKEIQENDMGSVWYHDSP